MATEGEVWRIHVLDLTTVTGRTTGAGDNGCHWTGSHERAGP